MTDSKKIHFMSKMSKQKKQHTRPCFSIRNVKSVSLHDIHLSLPRPGELACCLSKANCYTLSFAMALPSAVNHWTLRRENAAQGCPEVYTHVHQLHEL